MKTHGNNREKKYLEDNKVHATALHWKHGEHQKDQSPPHQLTNGYPAFQCPELINLEFYR